MRKLTLLGGYFDFDNKINQIELLFIETQKDNFWENKKKAEEIINKLNKYKKETDKIIYFEKIIEENNKSLKELENTIEYDLIKVLEEEVVDLKKEIELFETIILLNGKYDENNCILEIHSGAGGTEACDWAYMLYRMYTRYCESNEYKYELIDYQDGEEAGIKSATILIKGQYSFGMLKGEVGVHRLVRISPFDSNSRRHTSFASVEVIPEIEEDINLNIREEDLKIDVYRSSGAGGQSVNTTDSAVRITHLPTKTVVTCQNERSQIKNKERALKTLKNKLYLLQIEQQQEKIDSLKGQKMGINFGSQIRSYVMHPYSMVKDHRTEYETSDVNKVLDGYIDEFLDSYLRWSIKN